MAKLESLGAVLNFAIDQEKKLIAFYTAFADNTSDGKHRDMFLGFSMDKTGNKRKLETVKSQSDQYALNKSTPSVDIGSPPAELETSPNMKFQEVLACAIQRETLLIDLYSRMADSTSFVAFKTLCIALAKQEEKHRQRLETVYKETT